MKDIEQLFSEIKSNNKDGAKSTFDGIIADKVTKALDARKAAIAQKRFNESVTEETLEEGEDAESVTEAKKEFKNGDKVYIHDGDSWGPEVHFEGVVIGYVGDKVKIKGTGEDKGKTETSEEKFVALQTDFDESVTKKLSEDDSYYALKDAEKAAGGAAAFKKLSYGEQDALLSKEMEKLGYKKHPTSNTWIKK